jgi:hypothetical protein
VSLVEGHDAVCLAENRGFDYEFVAGIRQQRPDGARKVNRLPYEAKGFYNLDDLTEGKNLKLSGAWNVSRQLHILKPGALTQAEPRVAA